MKLRVVPALLALSSSACLFGEVGGIPCGADDECPSSYFCDLPRETCVAESDTAGVPSLVIHQVKDPKGDVVRSPFIPPEGTSRVGLLVKNEGVGPAEGLVLELAPLHCIAFDIEEESVPQVIEGSATAEIGVRMTPPGPECEGLKIVDWFLTFSGRETRGTIDVNITDGGGPAPPPQED